MTAAAAGVPLTLAERCAFRQTGRTDEAAQLCEAYLYPIFRSGAR